MPSWPSRVRRAPLSWSYRPRALRTLSSLDIDAFNRQLHRKRPKFIGKRGVSSWPAADGDVDPATAAAGHGAAPTATKRGPRRKFLGKKSEDVEDTAGGGGGVEEIFRRTIRPARKFLGKRGPRKFLGRRSDWRDNAATELLSTRRALERDGEARLLPDKRARRKFLG